MKHWLVGVAISLSISLPANATAFVCEVKPASYLGIGGDGSVVSWVEGVGIIPLCNIRMEIAEVTAQACTAWYSTLLTWRAQNKIGHFYFDSNNASIAGRTSCGQLSQWQLHAPYFLQAA